MLIFHKFQANFALPVLPGERPLSTVVGITWDCSSEFDASSEDPVSFIEENSYISFPNWISRNGALVSFKVRRFCCHLTQLGQTKTR